MKKKAVKQAAAEPTHPKKTFWARFGLFLLSFAVSAAFAAAWIGAALLWK